MVRVRVIWSVVFIRGGYNELVLFCLYLCYYARQNNIAINAINKGLNSTQTGRQMLLGCLESVHHWKQQAIDVNPVFNIEGPPCTGRVTEATKTSPVFLSNVAPTLPLGPRRAKHASNWLRIHRSESCSVV